MMIDGMTVAGKWVVIVQIGLLVSD
jgi:hypothetical protein